MFAKQPHYFWIILLALLTACGTTPQAAEMTKVQNTALAIAQTGIALTQTAMPTATPTNAPTALPFANCDHSHLGTNISSPSHPHA